MLILGCIESCSDILAIWFPISCDIAAVELQLVPEQLGLSQVFPSQVLLPHVSGVQTIDAMDALPSDIAIDVCDIDISDVMAAEVFSVAIESCLLESFPKAATEALRAKTPATPNQTFCVFIFFIPYLTNRLSISCLQDV